MVAKFDAAAEIAALKELVQGLQARLEGDAEAFAGLNERVEGLAGDLVETSELLTTLSTSHAELSVEVQGALYGYEPPEEGVPEDESEEQRATRVGLRNRVDEIEVLVRGRNRSAPTKRNMTDVDALRVLKGDVKDLGHKEAGEQVGLTYAQVYSCRMEYTFKHIHKKLRDEGWKNPFVK